MSADFITLPESPRFMLLNATIPAILLARPVPGAAREGLTRAHLIIGSGLIEAVLPATGEPAGLPAVDLAGGMAWPCFTDMHTHLDKGHIWERSSNPDGSFMGALETVAADREANWTAEDIAARMAFSLRSAYAHGTRLIRTHIDSTAPQHLISFEVFKAVREEWKGRIELQAAALIPLDAVEDEAFFRELVSIVADSGALMGGVPYPHPNLEAQLDTLFRAAADAGLDLDLHVDETEDPAALTIESVARAKIRHGFEGTVTIGHCCSLGRQDDRTARHVIDLVAEADIAVVSLPMCNMYLQDRRAGRTPRWRGVTLFKELAAAGVRTAVASDNARDPFYSYGDLDPVEVFREAVRILHLDHPLDETARIVTRTPAGILGRPEAGVLAEGAPADLVLFKARRWSEFLSRPQSDRVVLRNGAAIDRSLPDYSELDSLAGSAALAQC